MARMVVVTTSPVDREALADHVGAEDELVVVAPAVEQSRLDWLTNDEGEARGHAQAVGEIVAEEAPADAETVEVKPDPPSRVVRDAIAEHDPDRILVVVRKDEDATWLEDADRIPGHPAGVPVTIVRV